VKIVRNTGTERVIDIIRPWFERGCQFDVVTPAMSLFAFSELRRELSSLAKSRILLPPQEEDLGLWGTTHDRGARNRLQGRWLAKKLAEWIRSRSEIRRASNSIPQGAFVLRHTDARPLQVLSGSLALSTEGLPDPERPEVLGQLRSWVYALYEIRNAYTHGKTALTLEFQGRSIWQDAFEVFRLAANRRILLRPEGRAMDGSKLEKRLMSVQYYDAVVRFLSDRDRWLRSGRKLLPNVEVDEIIRKGRVLDPGLIVSITSLPRLRQALFNICMAVWDTLEHCGRGDCDGRSVGVFLQEFEETYRSCMKPKLDTDAFIRKISPRLGQWVPTPVVANSSTPLFELLKVQQNLLFVYRQSTGAV